MKFSSSALLVFSSLLFAGCSPDGADSPRRARFAKQVEVFGLNIYATNTTGDDKLLHAARILAEYIDHGGFDRRAGRYRHDED
ncbi:MAG: hypothetical protein ACYSWQ_10690 [Planctomycetota bacterium]|jgi:hypothetical protein